MDKNNSHAKEVSAKCPVCQGTGFDKSKICPCISGEGLDVQGFLRDVFKMEPTPK